MCAIESQEGEIDSTSPPKHLLHYVRAFPLAVRLAKILLLEPRRPILPRRCRIVIHEMIRIRTMHRANPSLGGSICVSDPMSRDTFDLLVSAGMRDLAMGQTFS